MNFDDNYRMTTANPTDPRTDTLHDMCEQGQRLLSAMKYLEAERVLAEAEAEAWNHRQWEVLARLYLPLQETRRQIRQWCGMGAVALRLLAEGINAQPNPADIVRKFPKGQLLVAGWGSIEPARQVRRLAAEHNLYLETFLAAVYPDQGKHAIVIAPTDKVQLPPVAGPDRNGWQSRPPAGCLVLQESELPSEIEHNSPIASSRVMGIWERLHGPLLAAADAQSSPIKRMEGYRHVILVDRACELAHQKLSAEAREMARMKA